MIPSLLSISLICGCIPSMAFIFLATSTRGCPSSSLLRILAVRAFWMVLIAAASPSPQGLELLGLGELGLKRDEELVFVHGFVSFHGLEELSLVMVVVVSGSDGGDSEREF